MHTVACEYTLLSLRGEMTQTPRSNPYQGHPCHIEIFLSTPSAEVPRAKDLDVTTKSSKKGKKVAAIEA